MRNVNQGEAYFRRDVERHALEVNNSLAECILRLDNGIRSLTVESPSSSEHLVLFYVPGDLPLTALRAVLDATPPASVSWTLRYGTDITATGTEVIIGGTTTTNYTTGDTLSNLDNTVLPAATYVWLETSSTSGSIRSLTISLVLGS